MIFIILGSQKFQFNRLLQAVDALKKKGEIKDDIIAQSGYSDYKPSSFQTLDFVGRADFEQYISKADLVICHGGTGAIITALKRGRKVIAVPRNKNHGEHVDDHQFQIVSMFADLQLLEACQDVKDLGQAIRRSRLTDYQTFESNNPVFVREVQKDIEKFAKKDTPAPETRLKILHIPTSGVNAGGITTFITNTMEDDSFAKDVDCYVLSPIAVEASFKEAFAHSRLHLVEMEGRRKNPIAYFLKLLAYMKRQRFDLVHVHGSSAIMSVELLAAKLAGVGARIAHSHNITCEHRRLHKALLPVFAGLYTHGAACSEAAGEWLFGRRDFRVIYNGIDLRKFRFSKENRVEIRSRLGLGEENFVLGCVGHFNRQKNHDFLLDLFQKITQAEEGARLLLIGSGSLEGEIKEKVRRLHLEEKVLFPGHVRDVHRWLSAMDAFVLPSLFEGFSIVLAEAQANALVSFTSTNTPRTVALTSNINYLPLERGPAIWAEEVLRHRNEERRLREEDLDRLSLLDIRKAARNMREYYLEILKNKGRR